jgi:hypothetical protein
MAGDDFPKNIHHDETGFGRASVVAFKIYPVAD